MKYLSILLLLSFPLMGQNTTINLDPPDTINGTPKGTIDLNKVYVEQSATLYADEYIVDLQPDATDGVDVRIYSATPNNNGGVTVYVNVGENNSVTNTMRTLIKFDLDTIPDDAIITQCLLYLHVSSDLSSNARDYKVYRMKRSWIEGTKNDATPADGATWNTYDGSNNWTTAGGFSSTDCEQTAIGSVSVTATEPVNKCIVFNINATSKDSLDLGYGWMLKADTENNDQYRFVSSDEATNTFYRPALFISYILPTEGEHYAFDRDTTNPFLIGQYGSVWYNGAGDYVFYYSDATNVNRATSTDGYSWTNYGSNPVLTPASGVIDVTYYWKEGSTHYMLYRSNEWSGDWGVGLATSSDGISWNKSASNPVLTPTADWEDDKIDPWGLIKIGSTYYLWINNVGVAPRQTGLVTSTDLVNWTRNANNPIFADSIYCVQPFKYGDYYYMLACHATTVATVGAAPLEKQIVLYRDSDPRFLPSNRQFLGYVLTGGGLGAWDGKYLDTPTIITNDITRSTFPDDDLWMYYCGATWETTTKWWHGLAKGSLTIINDLSEK